MTSYASTRTRPTGDLTYDEKMNKMKDLQNESEASTERTLRDLHEMNSNLADTSTEVHRQGRQLKRINGEMEELEEEVNYAGRVLRGMQSIFNPRGRRKKVKPRSNTLREGNSASASDVKKSRHHTFHFLRGNHADEEPTPSGQSEPEGFPKPNPRENLRQLDPQLADQDSRIESNLDEISSIINQLKLGAYDLSNELDNQSETMDSITTKVDNTNIKFHENMGRMRTIT